MDYKRIFIGLYEEIEACIYFEGHPAPTGKRTHTGWAIDILNKYEEEYINALSDSE